MDRYYIIQNGEQVGPYDLDKLEAMLSAGEIGFFDLCWREGMDDWKPMAESIEFKTVSPPPKAPAMPPPPPGSKVVSAGSSAISGKSINWIPALVLYSVSSGVTALYDLATLGGGDDNGAIALALSPVIIVAVVFIFILHYRCWQAVDETHRVTTPGKAVGYMFIPFYNCYWAFISYPKLVQGLVDSGYQLKKDVLVYAQVYAGIFLLNWLFLLAAINETLTGFASFVGVLVTLADLAVWILLYKNIVEAINAKDA